MGGYFGGMLARGGEEVTLIARGAHLEAIQDRGLTLKSQLFGESTLSVKATDDPGQLDGPVDLVLFCVKTYDLAAAAAQIRPLVGPDTAVIPVQNGIEVPARLGQILGAEHVLGGMTYVAGNIEAPGVVAQRGGAGELIFGELEGGTSRRAEGLLDFFQRAGLPTELRADIRTRLWEKFVVICATGGVLALLRLPFGPVFASAEASELMQGVMGEVGAVAQASRVELPEYAVERLFTYLKDNMAPTGRSSQLQDLQAGRRLELEFLNGTTVRLGRQLGVPTPLNSVIYAALKPYVDGPPELPAE